MNRRVGPFMVAGALGVAWSNAIAQAGVQAGTCTYARCALHLDAMPGDPLASRLVQGIEARPVEMSGVFTVHIPLFEASPDNVRAPYRVFQGHERTSREIFVATLVGAAATGVVFAVQRSSSVFPALCLDVGLGIGGLVERKRASDALETAIERYNAALPSP